MCKSCAKNVFILWVSSVKLVSVLVDKLIDQLSKWINQVLSTSYWVVFSQSFSGVLNLLMRWFSTLSTTHSAATILFNYNCKKKLACMCKALLNYGKSVQ